MKLKRAALPFIALAHLSLSSPSAPLKEEKASVAKGVPFSRFVRMPSTSTSSSDKTSEPVPRDTGEHCSPEESTSSRSSVQIDEGWLLKAGLMGVRVCIGDAFPELDCKVEGASPGTQLTCRRKGGEVVSLKTREKAGFFVQVGGKDPEHLNVGPSANGVVEEKALDAACAAMKSAISTAFHAEVAQPQPELRTISESPRRSVGPQPRTVARAFVIPHSNPLLSWAIDNLFPDCSPSTIDKVFDCFKKRIFKGILRERESAEVRRFKREVERGQDMTIYTVELKKPGVQSDWGLSEDTGEASSEWAALWE